MKLQQLILLSQEAEKKEERWDEDQNSNNIADRRIFAPDKDWEDYDDDYNNSEDEEDIWYNKVFSNRH